MSWIGKSDRGTAVSPPAAKLSQEVAHLLDRLRPMVEHERRGGERTPIPYLFELSPLDGKLSGGTRERLIVVGKDISERGIGIYHEHPIPYRRGVLTVELPGDGPVHLEVDLLWCRFTSIGWYESGGRLLSVTSGEFPEAPRQLRDKLTGRE